MLLASFPSWAQFPQAEAEQGADTECLAMAGVQEPGAAYSLKSSLPDPQKTTHLIFTEESSQNYATRADPESNRCFHRETIQTQNGDDSRRHTEDGSLHTERSMGKNPFSQSSEETMPPLASPTAQADF